MADELPPPYEQSDDQLANEQLEAEREANEHRAEERPADEQNANERQTDESHAEEPRTTATHVHRERYEIARNPDCLLIVKQDWFDTTLVYEFEVARSILSAIPFFARLFAREPRDGEQEMVQREVIELTNDNPRAWKGWLEILHGRRLERSSYQISTTTVWHMLTIAEKYGISPTSQNARDWFDQWLVIQSGDGLFHDYRRISEVLFPCHAFDHALGFSAGTKWLAYNSVGHIKEQRPAYYDEDTLLRLDHGIMQQVNAARGRLKTILHRELYESVDILLEKVRCPLKKDILWEYFSALNKTKSWPLERYMARESISGLLHNLEYFEYHDPHSERCNYPHCGCNFKRVVDNAIDETAQLFDGLCLDCMNETSATNADKRSWKQNERHRDWSEGCRVVHGEPTYFYSIMRRREERVIFV